MAGRDGDSARGVVGVVVNDEVPVTAAATKAGEWSGAIIRGD